MTDHARKILLRDDTGQPLAVACKNCGRFCLDVRTATCARCWIGGAITHTVAAQNDRIVTQAADRWLREGKTL